MRDFKYVEFLCFFCSFILTPFFSKYFYCPWVEKSQILVKIQVAS